jgi:drug/metabolite transporter (DMT)-like permease
MTITSAQAKISPSVLLAAASIVVIWPTAFSFIKMGLEYFSPLGLMTFRMLCGMAAMLAYVLVRRYPIPRGRDLLALAISGLCGVGLYSYFINLACQTITAGETAFLIALNPLFVALAGWWFYHEKIGYKTLTGMAISLSGVGPITSALAMPPSCSISAIRSPAFLTLVLPFLRR